MGASTGNMLVDDPGALEGIFGAARLPVATHCEDSPMIRETERRPQKNTATTCRSRSTR